MTASVRVLLWGGFACVACATPSLDFRTNDHEPAKHHSVFRVDWRAMVAPSKETVPPLDVEQTRWEPLEVSSPAVAQTKGCASCAPLVVVGASDGRLLAFNRNGKLAWTFHAGELLLSPTVADGVIYVGSGEGKLYAISAADGSQIWSYACNEELGARPTVGNGTVYVQSHSDTLFALEAATGKWRWQYRRETHSREFTIRSLSPPALVGGLVVTGFSDGSTVALKQVDGAVSWQHVPPSSAELKDANEAPQTDGKRVFVANYRAGLAALAADDGHILWQKSFPTATRVAFSEGIVFAAAVGKVAAFSAFDGAPIWERSTGSLAPTGIALFPGGVIFSTDGPLLFLNARTGHSLGRGFNPGHGIAAAPTVWGRDLYVLSNGGWLYGLRLF